MFAGVASDDKDPRKSIHVDEFPLPELAPDEAFVGGDGVLDQLQHGVDVDLRAAAHVRVPQAPRPGERVGRAPRPAVPRDGQRRRRAWCCASARRCATGSRATRSPCTATTVDDQDPTAHDDSMMATNQRIWGFETNFGGLAEISVVKANQLMPKPAHLTWEEAAVNALVQLHELPHDREPERLADDPGPDRAGLGRERRHRRVRVQYVLNGGGTPVGGGVESRSAPRCCARWASKHVIDRRAEGYKFWNDDTQQDPASGGGSARRSASSSARDLDIVFEHPGRSTMGASVFVAKRGGMIITCAATSGFMIEYDNRYLWMNLKTLKGCHFANYREAWEANRLDLRGQDPPDAVEGVHRSTTPARPRTRCTTTCTRASSACCASRPRRGSASPTPRCASDCSPDHAVPAPRVVELRCDPGRASRPGTCCGHVELCSPLRRVLILRRPRHCARRRVGVRTRRPARSPPTRQAPPHRRRVRRRQILHRRAGQAMRRRGHHRCTGGSAPVPVEVGPPPTTLIKEDLEGR